MIANLFKVYFKFTSLIISFPQKNKNKKQKKTTCHGPEAHHASQLVKFGICGFMFVPYYLWLWTIASQIESLLRGKFFMFPNRIWGSQAETRQ